MPRKLKKIDRLAVFIQYVYNTFWCIILDVLLYTYKEQVTGKINATTFLAARKPISRYLIFILYEWF